MNRRWLPVAKYALATLAVVPLVASCQRESKPATPASAQMDLSEPQAAGVLVTVNQSEIRAAQMASTKASDPRVRQYAREMVRDHAQALASDQAQLQHAEVPLEDSAVSAQLKRESQQVMSTLQQLSGPQFDQAYMQTQANQHQKVLGLIRNELLPAAEDPAFRTILDNTQNDVAQRAEEARTLATSLSQPAEPVPFD